MNGEWAVDVEVAPCYIRAALGLHLLANVRKNNFVSDFANNPILTLSDRGHVNNGRECKCRTILLPAMSINVNLLSSYVPTGDRNAT